LDNAGVYHEVGGNHQHYMQGDIPFTEVHTFVTLKPEFVDEAIHIMKEEMTKACEHIDEADFEEFKQGKLKFFANRKSDDNFYWLKTIEHYASTGEVDLGNDDVQIIQALTPEDISAFARKLLTTGNMVEIVMTPAE
jgi:zinc protease